MFFIHKYAPKDISETDINKEELSKLKEMCNDPAFPNMIVYGPEGCGKKTAIRLALETIYNKSINNLSEATYPIVNGSGTTVDVGVMQSDFHIVIEPKNNASDKHIIQGVIKEYVKRNPIGLITHNKPFKVILIDGIDDLSYYAQTSLRRTMEKYSNVCRFIMWSENISKVIEPLRSRCYLFRLRSPAEDVIFKVILDVMTFEKMEMDFDKINEVIDKSGRNIRNVLWNLQLLKYGKELEISYDKAIDKLVDGMMMCDMSYIGANRNLVYSLFITKYSGGKIIHDVVKKLVNDDELDDKCKLNIMFYGTKYDHRYEQGRRDIIHLDGFLIWSIREIGK